MCRTARLGWTIAAVVWLVGAGCGDDPTAASAIRVSAASSLRAAFTEIAGDFMDANPDVEVSLSFDSSTTLATQLLEGAAADVFASADEANMARLTAEELVAGRPQPFARNQLVIVSKPGNPDGVASLADLADAGVISLCGDAVPCGRYAAAALRQAGVTIPESRVTRGQNATATLTAVTEGDAIAGVVYASDAQAAGDAVEVVPIPATPNALATYSIGELSTSARPSVAAAFVDHVLGDDGRRVLADHGFLPPS